MSGEEETRKRERWRQVGAILDAVLDAPPDSREHILAERCAGDPSLRDKVEALLAVESRPDQRLDSPVGVWADALLSAEEESATSMPGDAAGDRIGPYRLVRELGRGGMGTVWLAERADGQFEQQVALKLLKRGLDSEAILARFLEERRILAGFRHPHIAQLFDGGIANDGRPYYALEYIDGALITKWCDDHGLGVRKRLLLFLDMVEAVQHAHQRLIVHRDLKPGNVMVSGEGEVKLLDFGIAKVLDAGQDGADAATLTRMGWRMLTPEYAAPEQLRGDPATTATDVYSLGVLLHELLTGSRPEAATGAGPETAKPLPRPSSHVTADAAARRGGNPERLRRTLRGDLDTIILKALQAEPERRYGSAQTLADDLRRYLNGAPVRARPDTAWYRARRFITRHRWGTAVAALIVVLLAAGIATTSWQAREARRQADEARKQTLEALRQARRAEQVKTFLASIFEAGDPLEWRGREVTARDLLDRGAARVDDELAAEPELHAEMLSVIGDMYRVQNQFDRAETLLRRSLDERRRLFGEDHPDYADSLNKWGYLRTMQGDLKGAEQAISRALEVFQRKLGNHPQTSSALSGLSDLRVGTGDIDEAIHLRRQALRIDRRAQGATHKSVADNLSMIGVLLISQERYEEAKPLLEEGLGIYKRLYGVQSGWYASGLRPHARLLDGTGYTRRAAGEYAQVVDVYRKAGDLAQLESALNDLGNVLCRLGRFDEAERDLREALDLARRNHGAGSRWESVPLVYLGRCLVVMGKPGEAEPLLRKGGAILARNLGPRDHEWTPYALRELARALADQGRIAEARIPIEDAVARLQGQYGRDHPKTAFNLQVLAGIRFEAGEREQGLAQAAEAARVLRKKHGIRHPQAADAALNLASLELRANRERQAEARLREIVPVLDAMDHKPQSLEARMLRGVALTRLGRVEEGEELLRDVLAERRKIYGETSAKASEAEIHLGSALLKRGEADEGRRLLQRGRAEFVSERGANHQIVRFVDAELAQLH